MRDVVEIGMGREARRTYNLHDVDIVPSRRTRSAKHVSTTWQIDAYSFEMPLMTHPSDAVVSPESAAEFSRLGGLSVLNGEGLWARHEDPAAEIAKLRELAADWDPTDLSKPNKAVRYLQQLHQAPLRHDLLENVVATMRESGHTVAVRVSPQHAEELAPVLIKAGVEMLVVQGTIISAEHVIGEPGEDGTTPEPLNLKDFIYQLDIPVIAGGVVDYRTALHLMRTGAAGVIVGFGHVPGASTTGEVLGMNVAMATAIADAAAARRDYLDETGGRYVHVIADGDIAASGDITRAIACGADAVSLGLLLAQSDEAPGKGTFWQSTAAHPSVPRGDVQPVFDSTVPMEEVLLGPTAEPFGTRNLLGGLRRAMGKSGYTDVKGFQKVDLAVRPD